MLSFSVAFAEEMEPDMALLEFLGEWEGEDGQWWDPNQLSEAWQDEEQQEGGQSDE